jgi:methionine-rich copper-binding protein CopC/putative copper export protein
MKAVAAGVAVVAFAAFLPGVAGAHPTLVETTPSAGAELDRAPRVVVVRLSEPADPVGEGISVTGPDGREVAHGPVIVSGTTLTRAVDARDQGSYVVEWLAVGDDTHPARGAFLFSVGEETRTALPGRSPAGVGLQTLGHWLSLVGFALGFGVPFAALLSGGITTRIWRLVSAGIVLMIVAEPVALLGQTATLAPSRMLDPTFAEDVFLTNYGHLAALRLGAALGLWALAGALRDASPRAQRAIPAAGVAVALVYAQSAHRIAGLPPLAPLLLVATHVAAFGAWLGCIIVALGEARGRQLARPAVLAALALVMTGSALALAHLTGPSDLLETAYGATLGVKVALVAVTLALGAAARRRAELAVALAVLATASLLVSIVPPG